MSPLSELLSADARESYTSFSLCGLSVIFAKKKHMNSQGTLAEGIPILQHESPRPALTVNPPRVETSSMFSGIAYWFPIPPADIPRGVYRPPVLEPVRNVKRITRNKVSCQECGVINWQAITKGGKFPSNPTSLDFELKRGTWVFNASPECGRPSIL